MNNTYEDLKTQLEQIDLREFASRHYGAVWNNNTTSCLNPSHYDNTPSMSWYVNQNNKQYLHCFGGCNKSYDIFSLVAVRENLDCEKDFVLILKKICELEGIKYNLNPKTQDPNIKNVLDDKLLKAMKFKEEMWSDENCSALHYLTERGLTDDTINTFHLGCTKKSHETRYREYIAKNPQNVNNIYLDNRLTIPIQDSYGNNVLGVSFRSLSHDSKCKYLHDSDSPVFSKNNILFGYANAISTIKQTKEVYVVEGYFDMMSLYQIGLKNTVACMTNTLSDSQIKTLTTSGATTINIVIDQDMAGYTGVFKSVPKIMSIPGISLNIIKSINYLGKDMNDLCIKLKWNSDNIIQILENNKQDAFSFYIGNELDKYDYEVITRRKSIMEHSMKLINAMPSESDREIYMGIVKNRLGI